MTGQVLVGQGSKYSTNPASSSITVTTDNTSYTMGDSIVVSGTVNTVDSINPQRPVIIQTYDGNDQFLRADKVIPAYNGQYSVTIHPNQLWQNTGTYTIKVQYDSPTLSQTTFYFNPGIVPPSTTTQNIATEIDMMPGAGSSTTTSCVATNNCFNPNPAYVPPGTTVTWRNTDTVSHYVTSGHPSDNTTGTIFDSGNLIKPGATYQFTFSNPGTYNYFCTVHPWMIGQVIVGQGGQPIQTPQTSFTPTQQDIQSINRSKASQTIAAEVNVGASQSTTTSIDSNVTVQTTANTPDSLNVNVSAPSQTGPKVIAFNLNTSTINVANLSQLGVMYDGKLIPPAPNMDAILHAKPTDSPSFAIVVTQSGVQVLVLVPHFSTHSITIMNMSKIMTTTIPEFPFAAVILVIATFSIVLISRIKQYHI